MVRAAKQCCRTFTGRVLLFWSKTGVVEMVRMWPSFLWFFLLKAVVVCARVQNREHSGNEKSCLPQRQPFSCACALWLCVFYCWPYPKKVQAKCVRVFFDEAWLCAKHKNKRTSATNNEPSPPAPKTQLFCGGKGEHGVVFFYQASAGVCAPLCTHFVSSVGGCVTLFCVEAEQQAHARVCVTWR